MRKMQKNKAIEDMHLGHNKRGRTCNESMAKIRVDRVRGKKARQRNFVSEFNLKAWG